MTQMRKSKWGIQTSNTTPMAVVRPDSRDGAKDFYIPLSDAVRLYREGKLSMDLTNGGYCLPIGKLYPCAEILDLKAKAQWRT